MSDLFPKVTSDEIDLDAAFEQSKREEECCKPYTLYLSLLS